MSLALVTQNNRFEDVSLGSGKIVKDSFHSFLAFYGQNDPTMNQQNSSVMSIGTSLVYTGRPTARNIYNETFVHTQAAHHGNRADL